MVDLSALEQLADQDNDFLMQQPKIQFLHHWTQIVQYTTRL
jgi:hypothetical protein